MAKTQVLPTCYVCDKRARKASHFCSNACACEWADAFLTESNDRYCMKCGHWRGQATTCEHCFEPTVSVPEISARLSTWKRPKKPAMPMPKPMENVQNGKPARQRLAHNLTVVRRKK
ncbi:MAG: hypothetical protein GY838_13470 [bacterium]|nr:hypothetical protein [bacterium]